MLVNVSTKDSKNSPFAGLEKLRDQLPDRPEVSTAGNVTSTTAPSPAPAAKGPARAVVRLERKGRRGKDVTIVDKLGLRGDELERWCRELKQALGCGGSVEGDAIILQGDLRPRLPTLLTSRGVRQVIAG
jgi:translation initiation factor 1